MSLNDYLLSAVRVVAVFVTAASPCAGQLSFQDRSALLAGTISSGAPIAVADMNGDGRDDLVRLDNARVLRIDYQTTPGAPFDWHLHGEVTDESVWAVCVADVDVNGFNDIFAGTSSGGLRLLKADATGTSYALGVLPETQIFSQGCLFADLDNDGNIDIFACDDHEDNHKYRNNGVGGFSFDSSLIDTSLPFGDGSGNYAAIWTDFDNDGFCDLYLSKCRSGAGSSDNRRINRLFRNNGSHSYSDVAPQRNLDDNAQSWCTAFGDIDNDGDLDCFILNHGVGDSKLYENNGTGFFNEITVSSGLAGISYYGIQAVFRDFDNDTFLDLLVSTSNVAGTNQVYRLYRNNGNKTFSSLPDILVEEGAGPIALLHSFAVGDLNHDGFLDIYGSRGTLFNSPSPSRRDLLFFNNGNANHYLAVRLKGRESNLNAIGARLELHGAWGTQVREVRAGEGYGIQNSLTKIFGLGAATAITKLVVTWPSGVTEEILAPGIDQVLQLTEGDTLADEDFSVPAIASGLSVTAETGRPLAYRVRGDNLPLSFGIENGPAGMTIEAESGVVSWIPDQEGEFNVDLIATNPAGSDRQALTITVTDPPAPVISGDLSQEALTGQRFLYQIEASNDPTSYALVNAPAGMTVDGGGGLIEWVPGGAGEVMVDVTASNAGGSDTETLTIMVHASPDYAQVIESGALSFSTLPEAAWFGQSEETYDGEDAMRSGAVGHDESSWMEAALQGPGTLTFWWKVSSEENFDVLVLSLDGLVEREISGTLGWEQVSLEIPEGSHTVRWTYEKDGSISEGDDAGYVDEVTYVASDSDGDGLDDDWERTHFGNLDKGADDDPDLDGQTNAAEQEAGTDPDDATSVFRIRSIARRPDGTVDVGFASVVGKRYVVQSGATLTEFTALSAPVTASGAETMVNVTVPGGEPLPGGYYFRVVVVE